MALNGLGWPGWWEDQHGTALVISQVTERFLEAAHGLNYEVYRSEAVLASICCLRAQLVMFIFTATVS